MSFWWGKLLVPHKDGGRIVGCFGKRHGFPDIGRLEHIARVGVPVGVEPGGNLEKYVAYGNHSNAGKWEDEVRGEAIADLVRCMALIFPTSEG